MANAIFWRNTEDKTQVLHTFDGVFDIEPLSIFHTDSNEALYYCDNHQYIFLLKSHLFRMKQYELLAVDQRLDSEIKRRKLKLKRLL